MSLFNRKMNFSRMEEKKSCYALGSAENHLAQIAGEPFLSYTGCWRGIIRAHKIPNAVEAFHFSRFRLAWIQQTRCLCLFTTEHHETKYKTENILAVLHDVPSKTFSRFTKISREQKIHQTIARTHRANRDSRGINTECKQKC